MTNINVIKTLYGLKTVEQQIPLFFSSMAEFYESKVDDLKSLFVSNESDAKAPFVSLNIDAKAWLLQAGSLFRALESDADEITLTDIFQETYNVSLDSVSQYVSDDINVCKANAALYSYLSTISPNTAVDSSKLITVLSAAVPTNDWDDRIRDIVDVFTNNSSLTPAQYSIVVAEEFEQVQQEINQYGEFKYDAYAISGVNLFTAALAEAVSDITTVFETIYGGIKRIEDLGAALLQTVEYLATKVLGDKLKGLKVDFETVSDSIVDGFDVPIAAFSVTFDMLCQMILLPYNVAANNNVSGLSTPYFLDIPASLSLSNVRVMIGDILATTAGLPYAMNTNVNNTSLISALQDFLTKGNVLTMALDPSLLMSIFRSGDTLNGDDIYRIHIYAMNYSTMVSQLKYDILGESYCSYGIRQSAQVENLETNAEYVQAILAMINSGKWMWNTPISGRTDYLGQIMSLIPLLKIGKNADGTFYLKDEYGNTITPSNVFFSGDVSQIDTPDKLISHIRFKLTDVNALVNSNPDYEGSLYSYFSDVENNWDAMGELGWTDKYDSGQMLGLLYICSLMWKHFSLMLSSDTIGDKLVSATYSAQTQDISEVSCFGFVDGEHNEFVYTPYVTNKAYTFSVHLQTKAERIDEAAYIVKAVLIVLIAAAATAAVTIVKRKLRSGARLLASNAYTKRIDAQRLYSQGTISSKQLDKVLRRCELNEKIANLLSGKNVGAATFFTANGSAGISAIIERIG